MFKVGDKAKGFKFDGDEYPIPGYDEEMDDVIGVVGEVSYIGDSSYSVHFEGVEIDWAYPADLWYLGKVEETQPFKIGDRVKFKKSSIDSGMIDATENDVFIIENFQDSAKTMVLLEGQYFAIYNADHLEHVKEEIVNNTEEQEIDWQVGQEVFCLLRGKGVVECVGENDGTLYVVGVDFGYTFDNYTIDGKIMDDHKGRVLFFSEPKIEAEKFPPKKPFAPTLKNGDVILVKVKDELYGEGTVRTVYGEIDDRIYISENHHYFLKRDILSIRLLSEEIIFN